MNLQEEIRKRNMSENDLMQYIVFEDECIKNGYTVQELCNLMEKNVRLGAYRQCLWERDMAISQLESLGVAFGEKSDVKATRHAKWIQPDKEHKFHDMYRCSNCNRLADDIELEYDYCPSCGARMDGE